MRLNRAFADDFDFGRKNMTASNTADLSFGQKAVGLKFNPSGDEAVENCKMMFAALIDQQNDLRRDAGHDPEKARLASIAITEIQAAQMWAVKAITWVS